MSGDACLDAALTYIKNMKNQKTGGSAFPQSGINKEPDQSGMTLRDYFAAAALSGFASSPASAFSGYADRAQLAYRQADAMLLAREVEE